MLSHRYLGLHPETACNDNGRLSIERTEASPLPRGILAIAIQGGAPCTLTYVADGVSIITRPLAVGPHGKSLSDCQPGDLNTTRLRRRAAR